MRVILGGILNAEELVQSKNRLEALMKINALETHSKIVEQSRIDRISKSNTELLMINDDKTSMQFIDKQPIPIAEGLLEGILGLDDDEEQWALDKINASAIASIDQYGASAA